MKKILLATLIFCVHHTFSQTQPQQPLNGYGGSTYNYDSVIKLNYDDGATGFMLYLPETPHTDSLPVVIFNHGYNAWNPMGYGAWINHIVRRGNIVIFPMYQKSAATSPSVFTPNAVTGVLRAIDTLKAHPEFTQPQLDKLCIAGHSYGGVVTANMADEYNSYGIPKPLAIMCAASGYGVAPQGLLPTYTNMDSTIAILCVVELNDNIVDSVFGLEIFDSTIAVPYAHKNLIIHHPDSTGIPIMEATHGQSCGVDSSYDNGDTGPIITLTNSSKTDGVDYYCYWKLFDALQDCALNGNGCTTAFGDTHAQKYMGVWSNNQPVIPLEVRPVAIATGLSVATNDYKIVVWPDPVNNNLTITTEHNAGDELKIFDLTGRQVSMKRIENNTTEVVWNVAGLPSGVYFISAKRNTEALYMQKFVVAR